MKLIYLDNAATSWPKPEDTYKAADSYARDIGGSPGRSGHRISVEAARIVFDARDSLSMLMGAGNPMRIVFCKNATEALNISIFGLLNPGDHAIATGMEHNSVLRPLKALEKRGVELSIAQCSPEGEVDPFIINKMIKKNTRVIYMLHASNVTGTIMPVEEVGKIAAGKGILFCLDAAQTMGALDIDVLKMNISLLAFTGHKSLFGFQGTGGLYIREGVEAMLKPLLLGGTGSNSEKFEQPDFMPDKYESGTLNTHGIAGLGAGVDFILNTGVAAIRKKEIELSGKFMEEAGTVKGLRLFGPVDPLKKTPVVSFLLNGRDPADIALKLDEQFGILSRAGLHCAPSAHMTIGSFPGGTNRFSFGYFNSMDDVKAAIKAVEELSIE